MHSQREGISSRRAFLLKCRGSHRLADGGVVEFGREIQPQCVGIPLIRGIGKDIPDLSAVLHSTLVVR